MSQLIRDPADWALSFGWHSATKCKNDARALRDLARIMRDTDEEGVGGMWARECERIAKRLDPKDKR